MGNGSFWGRRIIMTGYIQPWKPGKFRLFVSAGSGIGKKRIRHTKVIEAKSDREAEKQLALYIAEIEKGEVTICGKISVDTFIDKWLELHAEPNLAPKTIHRYKGLLVRIRASIGHIRLDKLKPMHLVEFYKNLREPDVREDKKDGLLAERTVLHYHRLIHTMLEHAVRWQMIPNNPAKRLEAPSVPDSEMPVYSQEQVRLLMDKLEKAPLMYWLGVVLPLTCGMREGEVFGLEWKDIDLKTGKFKIVRASQYIPGQGIFDKEPKTRTGKRGLQAPPFVLPVLKAWRTEQVKLRLKLGDKWIESDRLMTAWNGKALYPGTMSQWFPKFLREQKLDSLNYHGLRHTFATLMDRTEISDADLSRLLGHTKVSTTKNLYTHAMPGADSLAANLMQNIIKPSKNKARKASGTQNGTRSPKKT